MIFGNKFNKFIQINNKKSIKTIQIHGILWECIRFLDLLMINL
jgi:hypothetical protein